jgi:hypothetical protein
MAGIRHFRPTTGRHQSRWCRPAASDLKSTALSHICLAVPIATLPAATLRELATKSDCIVFHDGSVARRIPTGWFVYLQSCERDGDAGLFVGHSAALERKP